VFKLCCLGQLYIAVTKYLKEINLKEEMFILGHSFRDFSPWFTCLHCFWVHGEAEHHGGEHMVEQSSSPYGRQERKREGRNTGFLKQMLFKIFLKIKRGGEVQGTYNVY
jgi:hypothetical protein